MGKVITKSHAITTALLLVVFFIYVIGSLTVRASLCPDEMMRFDVPLFIINEGHLPNGWEESIRNLDWGFSYAFTVYGSSLLSAAFMGIAQLFTHDLDVLLTAGRFANVILATGTVYICILMGRILFHTNTASYLFALLVAFLPQYAFLACYINADISGIFSTALAALFLIRGVYHAWQFGDIVGLGLSLGICALSYYFAYGAIVVSIIVYFASTIRNANLKRRSAVRTYLLIPLFIAILALLVCGWFFIRNALLYNGDFLGMKTMYESGQLFARDDLKPDVRPTPKNLGYSMPEMLFVAPEFRHWLPWSIKSFIGVFGYMTIWLPRWMYYLYGTTIGLGVLLGIVALFTERKKKDSHTILLLIACLIGIAIPLVLSIYYSWATDYQPQGRYLICSIIPLMLLCAKGYEFFSARIAQYLQDKPHKTTTNNKKMHSVYLENLIPVIVCVVWAGLFVLVGVLVVVPNCMGAPFEQIVHLYPYMESYAAAHPQ